MQLARTRLRNRADMGGQSSSNQKAGCNAADSSNNILRSGFNPHPARRPSATVEETHGFVDDLVGFNPHLARRPGATTPADAAAFRAFDLFQSSPGQKAGCNLGGLGVRGGGRVRVSILTRPSGRVQPVVDVASGRTTLCFNPHLARRPGATTPLVRSRSTSTCFNPHPARRPSATPEAHLGEGQPLRAIAS